MEDLPSGSGFRPFSLQQGPNSAFRPWKPSPKKDLGIAETSNTTTDPSLLLQLAVSNDNAAHQDNNDMHVENSAREKNPIIDDGCAVSGAGNHAQAAQTDQIQDMDRKLKRTIANRGYSLKARIKKDKNIAELEGKAKSYETKIATIHQQLEAYKNHKDFLLIEQHNLKLQMAASEKDRMLKEVEIEKNKAKVTWLSELHGKQLAEARERMLNVDAPMHLMSNSNSKNSSSFRGLNIFSNPNEAQNGVGTSRIQTGRGQQLQNKSQAWIAKRGNGQWSTLNLNIVKSEPIDE